jgi:ribonucleoside-diphosphate reductase beta chain
VALTEGPLSLYRAGRRGGAPGVEVADGRLAQLGIDPIYGSANPFAFMALLDVQELSNFFERRDSADQVGISGTVSFDDDF